ncbi:MAG: hypothetical protein LBP58_01540 [Azoarcus sp.]|jgi:hypothetical protein|nr:hypothetical protein [Azoarcus sp.]
MPLPLLVPIALGIAGAFGVGKGVKAVVDSNKADDLDKEARSIVSRREKELEEYKQFTNTCLSGYGKKKLEALTKNVEPFLEYYQQLKNTDRTAASDLENLHLGAFTEATIGELKHSCELATSAMTGIGAGAGAGVLTAWGAYGGTMALATAGTGTAIGTLSGVAATNATLAWLGGGTLAAGGYGVAGGMAVLGTLVAGPALLIFGSILGAKADKKLDEARTNLEKAETFDTEVRGICQKLVMIQKVAELATDTLSQLRIRLRRINTRFAEILETRGVNFQNYSTDEKATVFQGVKFAQLIKAMIDINLLSEDGALLPESEQKFRGINDEILKIKES